MFDMSEEEWEKKMVEKTHAGVMMLSATHAAPPDELPPDPPFGLLSDVQKTTLQRMSVWPKLKMLSQHVRDANTSGLQSLTWFEGMARDRVGIDLVRASGRFRTIAGRRVVSLLYAVDKVGRYYLCVMMFVKVSDRVPHIDENTLHGDDAFCLADEGLWTADVNRGHVLMFFMTCRCSQEDAHELRELLREKRRH